MKFELSCDSNGKHFFRLVDEYGKVLLLSEGFEQKASALNGIETLKTNMIRKENIELKTSSSGLYYINLKTGNGQVIGTSTMFKTPEFRSHLMRRLNAEVSRSEVIDYSY